MARFKITMNGASGFGSRDIEADSLEIYEGHANFTIQQEYEYTDLTGVSKRRKTDVVVASFAPNSWISATREVD